MSEAPASEFPKHIPGIPYNDLSSLNTLDLCLPHPDGDSDSSRIWVIYVHGGGYRDPAVKSEAFIPALKLLLQDPITDKVAGFASISYRLSPYPQHETDPSSPDDPARNARHPDHVQDVQAAIQFLNAKYHFEGNYVLIGHSVGASLAFQVASGCWDKTGKLPRPKGLVGISGIYDLPAFVEYYSDDPKYREFISNGVGPEEEWDAMSPVRLLKSASWVDPEVILLAHSDDDGMVTDKQSEIMVEVLRKDKEEAGGAKGDRKDVFLPLKGQHDSLWEKGPEIARTIREVLTLL